MKLQSQSKPNHPNQIIIHQNSDWLDRQRVAGKTVAKILAHLGSLVSSQTPYLSTKDLEVHALEILKENRCTPTFLNYKGFPGAICTSVNKALYHGIPNSNLLQPGDVVKIDLGATFDGAIADAAVTVIYGQAKSPEHSEMIRTCKEALDRGIEAIIVGERIGNIGNAIHHRVKASPFNLITDYGGHGVSEVQDENGNKIGIPHSSPFIPSKSQKNEGVRAQPGMTFAIEPGVVKGSAKTWLADDGWTVMTEEIGSHAEHTVFVHENHVEILTA